MTARGHVVLALTPLICFDVIKIENLHYYLVVIFGALLPDIDEKESYIGRRLPFVSVVLKDFGVEHRVLTHRLIIPLAIAIISLLVFKEELQLWLLFAYGILMHSIGDLLTRGGITGYFYPFYKNTTIRLLPRPMTFYTGSVTEYIFIFLLAGVSLFKIGANYAS
jgi:inner membrane protein